jgi:pimeloyl-ACP methyl ester carboxylesterase
VLKLVALVALPITLVCGSNDAIAQDKFFNSNGVRLRYVEQGTGEAVVLLHGQGGFVEASWQETGVIDALARRHRVIALDQRGYGKSDKPHEPSAYGAAMGEDVVRLLDHLRIKRAHVIGYSMGARITSWLVVNRPDRLISATLGGSTYYVDTPEQRRTFEEQAKQAESGLTGEGTAEAIKRGNPGWSDAQVTEYIARRAPMNDPLATAANYRGTPGLFITEVALSATKVPLLHIVGSLDTGLPASRHLKDKVLPSIEFVVVPGATHIETLGRKEFVEAVEKFLSRHKSAP